jgi:hemerythrin-like domain-containing protein
MWDNNDSTFFRAQPLTTETAPLFNVLNHYHQRLENLLLCQQEALVEQRFELASQILTHYQALLSAHIQLENSLLLPLHERIEKPRWPSSLYQREHEKILTLLTRAKEKLNAAQSDRDSSPRRLVIELLDY